MCICTCIRTPSPVQVLIDAGATVGLSDLAGETALSYAYRDGHKHIVKLLRDRGAKLEWDAARSAGEVCELSEKGSLERLELLLDCGVDPGAADYDARTGLHLAASAGHLHITQHLIGRGVKPDVLDRWGNAPLADAQREGFPHVANFLQEALKAATLATE